MNQGCKWVILIRRNLTSKGTGEVSKDCCLEGRIRCIIKERRRDNVPNYKL